MKNTLPLISIITPSLNQGSFLEQTIRSVVQQNYPNLEYIVIDGGSVDDSVKIIQKYAKQIDYWVSEPDTGQADAIAKGFSIAKGDILAWLNSDDYYHPDALAKVGAVFSSGEPVDLVYGDCELVDKEGSFLQNKIAREYSYEGLKLIDYIRQPAAFFSRTAYEKIGGLDLSLNWTMDWDLWIRIGKDGNVRKINQILAAARIYEENKSRSGGWKRIRELIRLNRKHKIINPKLIFDNIYQHLTKDMRIYYHKYLNESELRRDHTR